MENAIPIYLPDFFSEKNITLENLQDLNPHLILQKGNTNQIWIQEKEVQDDEFAVLKFPYNFTEDEFEYLQQINQDIRLEANSKQLIIYKIMGGIISAITIAIIIGLGTWAMTKKRGRVYGEDADYKLPDPENPDEILLRKADVSYISYKSVPEEQQKDFQRAITIPPDVAIEVVSSKYGLKPALWKTEYFWLKTGVKLGLVICPFSKKVYVFEKHSKHQQSIYDPFIHPLLPEFVGDFSQ